MNEASYLTTTQDVDVYIDMSRIDEHIEYTLNLSFNTINRDFNRIESLNVVVDGSRVQSLES